MTHFSGGPFFSIPRARRRRLHALRAQFGLVPEKFDISPILARGHIPASQSGRKNSTRRLFRVCPFFVVALFRIRGIETRWWVGGTFLCAPEQTGRKAVGRPFGRSLPGVFFWCGIQQRKKSVGGRAGKGVEMDFLPRISKWNIH